MRLAYISNIENLTSRVKLQSGQQTIFWMTFFLQIVVCLPVIISTVFLKKTLLF